MKANELRIGNWVTDVFDLKNITDRQIDLEDFAMFINYCKHPLPFKPIKITDEWLIKLGFKYTSNGYYQFKSYKISDDMEFFFFDVGDFFLKLEYVNQLQNLYFALTGNDLY